MKTKLKTTAPEFFGQEKIGKVLLIIAPPVMLAQLIQALYNIVDSFFVGRFSDDALTAITVIYPIQLIIVALAVGTGVGANTYMAKKYAMGQEEKANAAAGTGMVLALCTWGLLASVSYFIMPAYVKTSASEPEALRQAVVYGRIVSVGSLFTLLEGNWSKVLQARGNMKIPMIAQIAGALTNVAFDPLLIFGVGPFPKLGVAGAAIATVAGQAVSAVIVGGFAFRRPPKMRAMGHYVRQIYRLGYSSIAMQMLYTVYILLLNIILNGFSDEAVTVLGLYYKAQSFFFIPLFGLQTCIVPVLSFNYARRDAARCRDTMRDSFVFSLAFMVVGVVCFVFVPEPLMRLFSRSDEVIRIGRTAFPIIGSGFLPAVFSLMMPVFFQAIGNGKTSLALSLTRQIVCLVPLFYLFSRIGLAYAWLSFPVSETISGTIGLILYFRELGRWKRDPSFAKGLPATKDRQPAEKT